MHLLVHKFFQVKALLFNNIKSSLYANYTLFNEWISILILFMSCISFSSIYSKRYKLSFHEEIMKGVLKISHFKREGKGSVD
ncbi:hypothetical protein COE30_22880 [Bacillus cereus]|nr:hypothetical protein COE30_22880 [Bacillus cereus]